MKKREFLKLTGIVGAGVMVSPFLACESQQSETEMPVDPPAKGSIKKFELSALAYDFNALEPAVDAMTMEIHHGKHHAGYVRKLNAALEGSEGFEGMDLAAILAAVGAEQTGIRNNAGGHWNHSLFWEVMTPGGANAPSGQLGDAMNSAFGDFDTFKSDFFKAAKTRFGSGWAWLSVDENKKLFLSSSPNQDNPLMSNISDQKGMPILGIDVWEHAYYLNYQNKRGDYISAFTDIVNWDVVAAKFATCMA